MKLLKPLLTFVTAGLLTLGAAQAATKTQECFNFFKAQDYSRAIQAGRQASRESPQLADAHFCLGISLKQSGDLDNALRSLQQAERLFTQKTDLGSVYAHLGALNKLKGDLQQALNYHSRELALARETGQRSAESSALNNIALVFSDRGDNQKALDYLQQAVNIDPNEESKPTKYSNIALIYSDLGDYVKALDYLDKSISIDRRLGQYHSAARTILNKGSILTSMRKFDEAQDTLTEGLAAIRKIGDRYWEAVAWSYFGRLAAVRSQQKIALEHYQEALRLARLAGATAMAEQMARVVDGQVRTASALSYGVIEIGSKGVKAAVVTSSRDKNGQTRYETGYRQSINTNIIQGVSDSGEFSPEAIATTTSAVKKLLEDIRNSAPNWSSNVTIAGSSALSAAMNRQDLIDKIRSETGITPIFINSAQELAYAIESTVNADLTYKTALLDIGSGNARIGYMIAPRGGRPSGQSVIDLRAGSVTLSELANKARKPGEDYLTALNRVVSQDLQPKFEIDIGQYPVLRRHNYFMLVGGAAWAMSTLMHPENQTSYAPLSRQDLSDYYAKISEDPQQLLNPDLSHITDPKLKAKAEKEIASVKNVFTLENLQAGARILKMVADANPFGAAQIYFAREGNWAYGLAETQALIKP